MRSYLAAHCLGWIVVCGVAWGAIPAHATDSEFDQLRINQLQVVGTHNSYHVCPPDETLRMAAAVNREAMTWNYTHAPFDEQLTAGVRSFELDLHWTGEELDLLHVPVLDAGSHYATFREGLIAVRDWSAKNPRHVPVSFLIELKTEGPRLSRRYRPADAACLEYMDQVIREVFSPEQLITPDDVRGQAATLRQAVLENGWPTLGESRGKVLLILHEAGELRDLYTAGEHGSLRGRAMFVRSASDRDDAACLVMDSPNPRAIAPLVEQGFLIRTRADSGLLLSGRDHESRRDAAFASGAQIVSTDFPPGEAHAETGYIVQIPDGATRVNPISGPAPLQGQVVPE